MPELRLGQGAVVPAGIVSVPPLAGTCLIAARHRSRAFSRLDRRKGGFVKKKIRLNRETLRHLGHSPEDLRQAVGGQSATCQIPSICKACYTKIGYPTCYNTCH